MDFFFVRGLPLALYVSRAQRRPAVLHYTLCRGLVALTLVYSAYIAPLWPQPINSGNVNLIFVFFAATRSFFVFF